jgi:hypothetical protein
MMVTQKGRDLTGRYGCGSGTEKMNHETMNQRIGVIIHLRPPARKPQMPDSEILHYFGTPIEQLSREELIEVVKYLYQEHAELLQSHRSLRKEHFCNLVQGARDKPDRP